MINHLSELHQFLKGKLDQNIQQVTINLINQQFNEKTFSTFISRVVQIPIYVKSLQLIMRNIDYEHNYAPTIQDFINLLNLHKDIQRIKLDFKKMFNSNNQDFDTVLLLSELGYKFIQNRENIQHIDLIYSNQLQIQLNLNQIHLYYKQPQLLCDNFKLIENFQYILKNWKWNLKHIDIELKFQINTSHKSNCIDILQSIANQKKVSVLKIKIKQILENKPNPDKEKYFINLKSQKLKVVKYIIKDQYAFNLVGQIQNLNSSIGYANFLYKRTKECFFKIELKSNILIIDCQFNYQKNDNTQVGAYIKQHIKTWQLEKVEIFKIQDDFMMQLCVTILQESKFRNLQQLFIDFTFIRNSNMEKFSLKDLSETLKKHIYIKNLDINLANLECQHEEFQLFSKYLVSLKRLEHFRLDISKSEIDIQQVNNIMINDFLFLSTSLKTFHYIVIKQVGFNYQQSHNFLDLTSIITSFPNITEFIIQDSNKIEYLNGNLKIIQRVNDLSEVDIKLKLFANEELKNMCINSIELKLTILNIKQNTKTLLNNILQDISSQIQKIDIYLIGQEVQLDFDMPISQYNGKFNLYLNNKLRMKKDDKSFYVFISLQDIKPILDEYYIKKSDIQNKNQESIHDKNENKLIDEQNNSKLIVINEEEEDQKDQSEEEKEEQKEDKTMNDNQINDDNQLENNVINDENQFENNIDEENMLEQKSEKQKKKLKNQKYDEIEDKINFNLSNLYESKDLTKLWHIKLDFFNIPFFQELIQNFPQNQQIKLDFQNIFNEDEKLCYLKNIFLKTSKNIKLLNIDLSSNKQLHNQGSIKLFLKLYTLKNTLENLSINLANTQIRQRGIQSITKHIAKFKNIRHLELDISNQYSSYRINSKLIGDIFKTVQRSSKKYLESFTFKSSKTNLTLDQQFFDQLSNLFCKLSSTLKTLHLDFSDNQINSNCDLSLVKKNIKNLPENLESFHFNINSVGSSFQENDLILLIDCVQDLMKNRNLKHLFYQISKHQSLLQYSQKYFLKIVKLINILMQGEDITFSSCNIELKIQQSSVQSFECKQLLKNVINVTPEVKNQLAYNFYKMIIQNKPIGLKMQNNQNYFVE